MLDELVASTGTYIETSPWLAPVAVFAGGALTACAPCVLAMVPLMMAFVAGHRDERPSTLRALAYSSLFVVGLSITFVAMGMIAALAGRLYGNVGAFWNWVVAAVAIAMGLHLAGLIKFSIPMPFEVRPRTRGALGALLLGLLFGVVSAPCAAPVLVVLLTYIAGSGASVLYGGLLLLCYALGHSALVLVAGTSMGAAKALIESKRFARGAEIMRRAAGAVIVLIGIYFGYLGFK